MTIQSEDFKNHKTISLRKFKLIETITSTNDAEFLAALEEILKNYRIAEYEAKMKPMSNKEYNDAINKGFEAYMRGETTSLENYLKEIEAEESDDD